MAPRLTDRWSADDAFPMKQHKLHGISTESRPRQGEACPNAGFAKRRKTINQSQTGRPKSAHGAAHRNPGHQRQSRSRSPKRDGLNQPRVQRSATLGNQRRPDTKSQRDGRNQPRVQRSATLGNQRRPDTKSQRDDPKPAQGACSATLGNQRRPDTKSQRDDPKPAQGAAQRNPG